MIINNHKELWILLKIYAMSLLDFFGGSTLFIIKNTIYLSLARKNVEEVYIDCATSCVEKVNSNILCWRC